MFFRHRCLWGAFGVGLAVFLLYGPILGRPPDHNGFRYLLAPWLAPIIPALYYYLFGFNPYRGYPAELDGLSYLDKHDDDAKRLVLIFHSETSRRVLLVSYFKVSMIIFLIMLIITLCFIDSLDWSV